MARIPPIKLNDSDQRTKEILKTIERQWGSSWNVTSTMANNPAIVEGFFALWSAIERSGLSTTDREVICMEMAVSNGCHYCVPAHRYTSAEQAIDQAMIDQLAKGESLRGSSRPAVIQRLVQRLVATKGKLEDQEFEEFKQQGISESEMIAAIAEIAHCTITNYLNRLAGTELDPFLEKYRHGFD
ncbi:MAG: carboxymuconolactone decarboxylase family protein [Gammaproteobacteria bacterium]|nr:carboxymuconolactone decarboxylase family protein [Gammaproteobacteria bacterium]